MTEWSVKQKELLRVIRPHRRAVVAFSGGVDSTLIVRAAAEALSADRVIAVTGRSPSVPAAALADALSLAERMGVEHAVIDTDEISNPDYASNPRDRCYHCKVTLYTRLRAFARERGIESIFNGTNVDDLNDHRPGLKAAQEFGVRSPAVEAGLTKVDIRALSRHYGLPTFDKPAGPCLSSRVPYGQPITIEKLRMIEAAERFLHALGIRECRVRHHDRLARIEIPPDSFARLADPVVARSIDDYFRTLGYAHVTLDLRGFRSGSLNEVIA